MKTLNAHLANYAAYHRDRRNIATHFVGIPMILFAVGMLLARPAIVIAGLTFSPTVVVAAGAALFYLRLDRRFGAFMTAVMLVNILVGHVVGALPTAQWLGLGLGFFVVGWAIQFVGHFFEGRKPAFVDDLVGLLVGPLFIVAEAAFALGLRLEVRDAVEAASGKTWVRPRGVPASSRGALSA